jgi:hypothetical protein
MSLCPGTDVIPSLLGTTGSLGGPCWDTEPQRLASVLMSHVTLTTGNTSSERLVGCQWEGLGGTSVL